jgi:hypothetical protein
VQAPDGGEVFVSDIFTEVDEDVRREELAKLWKHYGNLIVGAVFLVVAGVGGWNAYGYWIDRKAAEAGAAFDAAAALADAGKHSEAEAAFAKVAAEGTPGYRALAQLRQAGETAGRDAKEGVAAYDRVAGEMTGQPVFSEMAAIRAAFLLVDTAKFDDMRHRLEPLAGPKAPFRHTARELLALSAWRNGDSAASREWMQAATDDPEAPAGLRQRMEVLAALLPEPGKPSDNKPSDNKPSAKP